jgi:preprotein translocase subunit SecD
VFLFTHPVVALLARTRFFGGGHKLSGFDAEHLGRAVTYTGRGTTRNQPRRGARAPRPSEPSAQGSRAGREKVSVGAEEAFVGAGSGPVRAGTTIAERRAAAERARRQTLLTEPGGGEPDDEGPAEGPASGPGATDDARTGRRDD